MFFFSFPDFCSFHASLRLARVLLLARACTAAGGLYFAAIDVYGIVFRPLWYYRHFLGEENRAGFWSFEGHSRETKGRYCRHTRWKNRSRTSDRNPW